MIKVIISREKVDTKDIVEMKKIIDFLRNHQEHKYQEIKIFPPESLEEGPIYMDSTFRKYILEVYNYYKPFIFFLDKESKNLVIKTLVIKMRYLSLNGMIEKLSEYEFETIIEEIASEMENDDFFTKDDRLDLNFYLREKLITLKLK